MKREMKATFEMDCNHELQYYEDRGYCTMAYESVIGRGKIKILCFSKIFSLSYLTYI